MIIRKKYLFYTLAFTSAFIAAAVTSLDSFVGAQPAFQHDPWAFAFSLFFIGVFIALLVTLILSIPFRKKSIGSKIIDPSFKRLRLIKKHELKYNVVAGLMNAINTVGYCAIVSTVQDPSVILSFSQIVILYLLLMESITEKDVPTLVEVQSSVIVAFGAILASISLTGEVDFISILIVFIVLNPTWAIFSIYQRKLKLMKINNKPNDSINIRLWNVIFTCVFTAAILFFKDIFTSSNHLLTAITVSLDPHYFMLLAATMGTTFFAYVFYIRSLGLGKASVNNAIRASTIIFAIPFTIILLHFGYITELSMEPVMLLIKVIGMILIMMGIISFALTAVKAYIFITVKPGYPLRETMDKLWSIRGVTHVSATSGKYDFIVKVSTRTLMKGYEKIVRKIEEIDAIKKYRWESVLKDWENI
ncbi:MAG: Lrp/AsnC ligand binding domain-containing protein [Candidatus Thermoplasmatota archaeon]|jgi:DNA-binding Lrp family transcriptional regulator|nr:Lrp/AsnC ligand binding domain-containing protein [Candidatus Thermoplasmatota archaeon]